MYAIIKTGGKQYKVAEGDVIDVEKLDAEIGDTVEFDTLMLSGEATVVDPEILAEKKVSAEVLDQFRGEKVLVFKLKKRKRYHRTQGHRQYLTKVKIASLPSAE